MNTTFIGGGNMATALIGSLIARGEAAAAFRVVEPSPEARNRVVDAFPGLVLFERSCPDAVSGAAVVVLAVKPQQMRAAASALAADLGAAGTPVVLTIAAGIRIADLSRWLGGYPRIVRAMPNTPALIGRGISGVYSAPAVDAAGRANALAVLEAAGGVVWVDAEERLDAITAVSGSGPAYVFYFIEALEEAARAQGFGPADARRLAYATFAGAIALAERSAQEPAVLRAQVTSKGGTTEAALAAMQAAGVKSAIVAGVDAAATRARALGDVFGRDA
jgi:pyrroline-5-carboxylate reductase